MGWFDEQLRQRRASDDEMLSLAFMQLADAVTGAHIASAMRRDGKQSEKDGLVMRSCVLTDSEEGYDSDAYAQQLVFNIKI